MEDVDSSRQHTQLEHILLLASIDIENHDATILGTREDIPIGVGDGCNEAWRFVVGKGADSRVPIEDVDASIVGTCICSALVV